MTKVHQIPRETDEKVIRIHIITKETVGQQLLTQLHRQDIKVGKKYERRRYFIYN